MEDHRSNWFKKHADTIAILSFFARGKMTTWVLIVIATYSYCKWSDSKR